MKHVFGYDGQKKTPCMRSSLKNVLKYLTESAFFDQSQGGLFIQCSTQCDGNPQREITFRWSLLALSFGREVGWRLSMWLKSWIIQVNLYQSLTNIFSLTQINIRMHLTSGFISSQFIYWLLTILFNRYQNIERLCRICW